MELPREIQIRMTTRGIKREEFKDWIIFMSMYTMTSIGKKKKKLSMKFFEFSVGLFPNQELKKNGTERTPTSLTVSGTTPQL